jgi:serine protease
MTRTFTAAVAALCATLCLAAAPMAQAQEANARVIVQFKADSTLLRKQVLAVNERHASQALALGQRTGMALTSGSGVGERSQVVFARGMSSQALADRLARESDVEFAVPDQRKRIVAAPNDTLYQNGGVAGPASGQWYLRAPSSTPGGVMAAINAEAAWNVTTGSPSIVVAVLDTGIRAEHPDLNANLLPGYDMVGADTSGGSTFDTANDGNGRDADPSDPGDWIDQADISAGKFSGPNGCTSADIAPSSWHGTQTAGLIGALTNNSIGMASVGRDVRILPVRVLGKCGGFDSDIVAGMKWAAGIHVDGVPDNLNPAKVINMSLGGGTSCSNLYVTAVNEIIARGVTIVASAGNGNGHSAGEPANCPGVIGVAGLRHIGSKVGYSDLGSTVSISAPAGNCVNTGQNEPCLYPILTTTNNGAKAPGTSTYSNETNASIGTSFSAPLVAGTAALMLSVDSTFTPAEVRTLLRSSSRAFPTSGADPGTPMCTAPTSVDQVECYCTTSTCGAGMLDAAAAVGAAAGVLPSFTFAPTAPVAGTNVSFDSAQSSVAAGRTIASRVWTIADAGVTGAALIGANNGVTASVSTSAAGRFIVSLTITDSVGATSSVKQAITVDAVAPPSSGGGGGGGGALGAGWLLALLAAVLLLARDARLRKRGG